MVSELKLAAWTEFRMAHSRVASELDRRLEASANVNLETYEVLKWLQESPTHKLKMNEVAARLSFTRGGATRLVDRMEKQGLAYRQASGSDRRVVECVITNLGEAEFRRAEPVFLSALEEVFAVHLSEISASAVARIFADMG